MKNKIKNLIKSIKKMGIKGTIIVFLNRKRQYNENLIREEQYKNWIENNEPSPKELENQKNTSFKINPKISIIVPMYNTPYDFFDELVNSLINQTYPNWELCLADGSSKQNEDLQAIIKKDERIKYIFLDANKGIAGNTNEAIKMATGDYIALFDHDDLLPGFSLFEIVKTINENPNVEFIYTDEDKISSADGHRFEPHFKPDFSLDFLRATNYICHFSVFKKELMNKLIGERSEYDGAQDYDIILRMAEIVNPENIIHIPKILYHWRVHENSTAQFDADSKPYAFEAGIKAIKAHLKRMNLPATVEHGENLGIYRVNYEVNGHPKISIIIFNKTNKKHLQQCIESVLKKTTYNNYELVIIKNGNENEKTKKYFEKLKQNKNIKVLEAVEQNMNYSKAVNYAIENCAGDYIIQLNCYVKIITKQWIENMLGFAQRKDVGAVGARIYYPNDRIKHAGFIFGGDKKVGFELFKGLPRHIHGYFAREGSIQNFSGVSSDCMMIKKSTFDKIGKFDESLDKTYSLDFCMKTRKNKMLIVYNPFVEVVNYDTTCESENFGDELNIFLNKWHEFYEKGDPYYNPNFSLNSCKYDIRDR